MLFMRFNLHWDGNTIPLIYKIDHKYGKYRKSLECLNIDVDTNCCGTTRCALCKLGPVKIVYQNTQIFRGETSEKIELLIHKQLLDLDNIIHLMDK